MQGKYPLYGSSQTVFAGDRLEWVSPTIVIVDHDDDNYYVGSYDEDENPYDSESFAIDHEKTFAIPHNCIDRIGALHSIAVSGIANSGHAQAYQRDQLIQTIINTNTELRDTFFLSAIADSGAFSFEYFNWNWKDKYHFLTYINGYLCCVPSCYFGPELPF